MACELCFVRRETVERTSAFVRSYLVVFKYTGSWSGALDPVDESNEPKTYCGNFVVESSKSQDSGWFLQQTPGPLVYVMKACGRVVWKCVSHFTGTCGNLLAFMKTVVEPKMGCLLLRR